MGRRDFLVSAAATSGALLYPRFAQAEEKKEIEVVDESITKIYVIFKTHLDIGFTDLAANVFPKYMNDYIPKAIKVGQTIRRQKLRPSEPRNSFKWTTGSWLIYKYLEEADSAKRKALEQGIEDGYIWWHALPFTFHSEVMDPSLFNLGLKMSEILDDRFGRKTIGAKMTDVPNHTRSIVPLLANVGVRFLHIGSNPCGRSSQTPPLFTWHSPDGSQINVMHHTNYGGFMQIPGTSEAVHIWVTGDNHGPYGFYAVLGCLDKLRKQYPNAEVIASDLSEIGRVIDNSPATLPVVTEEVGDAWLYGTGSDPKKLSQFRELSRLRRKWISTDALKEGSKQDLAIGIPLALVGEHTWGVWVEKLLTSWEIYKPEDLAKARKDNEKFKFAEASWQEKRQYVIDTINAMPEHLKKEAQAALDKLVPSYPDLNPFQRIDLSDEAISTKHFSLTIDSQTGALKSLQSKQTGQQWASAENPLCLFAYQTYSPDDYERFRKQFLLWGRDPYVKVGLEEFNPPSRTYLPRLKAVWSSEDDKAYTVLTELEVPNDEGKPVVGCPERLTIEYQFCKSEPTLEITLQCFDKQATRMPETLWFSFIPKVTKNGHWLMDKVGQDVDPRNVIKDGGHELHGIIKGIRYTDPSGSLMIDSLDAHLVAPADRTLLTFDNEKPAVEKGMHFCLCNNAWGTNFVQWYDDDMRFRFKLHG